MAVVLALMPGSESGLRKRSRVETSTTETTAAAAYFRRGFVGVRPEVPVIDEDLEHPLTDERDPILDPRTAALDT
jgi:hypothetical protein